MKKEKSSKPKAKPQQAASFEQLINPPLDKFKNELQYDVGACLAERKSDEDLREPFDLMIALAIVCARHVTAILISLRNLKSLCVSGRASFAERWLLCNGLYVLSAVNQRLRSRPDDEWERWPVPGGCHCFGIDELSTLLALDAFCTEIEVAGFEFVFRWIWSVTGRPVDCERVLSVISETVSQAGILNFIEWSHKFNLNIFMESELFPWQGDCRVPEIMPDKDECDLKTELDRVMLELQHEYHEAKAIHATGGRNDLADVETPKTDHQLIYQSDVTTFYNIPKSTLSKAGNKKPGEVGYLWSGREGRRVFYRKTDCAKLSRSREKLR